VQTFDIASQRIDGPVKRQFPQQKPDSKGETPQNGSCPKAIQGVRKRLHSRLVGNWQDPTVPIQTGTSINPIEPLGDLRYPLFLFQASLTSPVKAGHRA
jgi:hypothetical protein